MVQLQSVRYLDRKREHLRRSRSTFSYVILLAYGDFWQGLPCLRCGWSESINIGRRCEMTCASRDEDNGSLLGNQNLGLVVHRLALFEIAEGPALCQQFIQLGIAVLEC